MTHRLHAFFTVVVASGLAACGSGGGDVVGAWGNGDPDDPYVIEFRDDGTYEATEEDEIETGTWEADGDDLTLISDEDGDSYRAPYVVDGELLMVAAALPDGDVDGVVGTWRADIRQTEDALAIETAVAFVIDADGTGGLSYDSSDDERDQAYEGTWVLGAGDLAFTFEAEFGTVTLHSAVIPDVAIGGPLLTRVASE
jgi:hypothetical protein